jgi:OmcA/MtrC family decaheme c-type cytochrome
MNRSPGLHCLVVVAMAMVGLGACKGDTGPAGPPGPSSPGGATSAALATRLYAKTTSINIPNASTTGGTPSLTYRLFSDAAMTQAVTACAGGGTSGYAAFSPNFDIAKLVNDPANPGTKMWQAYINYVLNGKTVATLEGAHDKVAGTLKDNGDGSCTYTYQANLAQKVAPGSAVAVTQDYDPAAITRFGMQNNPTSPDATHPAFDGYADVLPSSGAIQTSDPRMLVADEACNACHQQIAHHGAKRLSVGYCVTCHNAGTPDPDPTSVGSTSLNLSVMIHKIHQGSNLPSVSGTNLNGTAITGAVKQAIVINGTDYSAVGFPQDTGNCNVCHTVASGTGSDYWKSQISIEACGACHDRTNFDGTVPAGFVIHSDGTVADGSCSRCHGTDASAIAPVTKVHNLLAPTAVTQGATLKIISVTSSAPGSKPVVTFAVTNPANNNANMDVITDPLWNNAGRRLVIDLGWTVKPGEDWSNSGSGAKTGFGSIVALGSPAPGQPASFDVLTGLTAAPPTVVKNADGTYTATLPVAIDPNAVGSGVAVLEGHLNAAAGATPIRTDTMFFAITDATATPRRDVVDIQKCDKCHGMLNLHGANRNDNINACVVCHNTEATDVTQRNGTGIDGKAEQSIDFATMIHSIHTGGPPANPFSTGIVVYAFTGAAPGAGTPNPTDFRGVVLPEGNSVGRCNICHADSNPLPNAADVGTVNGVTQITADAADQTTYKRTSRIAAVCSSCHGTELATAHMQQNGAGFGVMQLDIDVAQTVAGPGAETCALCHGKGQIADPALFHGH